MTGTELVELNARIEQANNSARHNRRHSIELPAALLGASRRGGETVLVVDDEPLVREVMTAILRSLGYPVLEGGGALEAQRLIGTNEDIKLLLTDFSMPQPNGLELAHWAQIKNPRMKMLITTVSGVESKPATKGRIKTSQSEAGWFISFLRIGARGLVAS